MNTNGVKQTASVKVTGAKLDESPLKNIDKEITDLKSDYKNAWIKNLERLNVCSQKGLAQQFDSTVGGGTVLAPYGGKYQLTPIEGMVAKLPVESGDTTTGTIMTYGYNPIYQNGVLTMELFMQYLNLSHVLLLLAVIIKKYGLLSRNTSRNWGKMRKNGANPSLHF